MYGEHTVYVNRYLSKVIDKDILTYEEFGMLCMIYSNINKNNNIFYTYINKINAVEVGKMFSIDRRKIMKYVDKYEKLGIIARVNNKKNSAISHLVLNHSVAFKDGFVLDNDIRLLFKDKEITKLVGEKHFEKGSESLKTIPKEHNIYILCQEIDGGIIYKLGYSSNIKHRIRNYIYHNPAIQIVKTFRIEDGKAFEKEFHNNNKSCYLNEWYSINPLEIIANRLN